MNVLVVDDSADVRFMLRFLLEEAGMAVDEAASGPAALELLDGAADLPDVVVLDQRMPAMTGLEAARELVARGTAARMILFSAYLHPSLQAEAEALGVTTVVKTELAALVDAVRGVSQVAA